jgi:hypothetical protein
VCAMPKRHQVVSSSSYVVQAVTTATQVRNNNKDPHISPLYKGSNNKLVTSILSK